MTDHEFKAPERTITAPDETTARLGEIRERVAAATEGPWEHGDRQFTAGDQADAEFIAHAREDVPWLLAEVERLTAERDRARDLAARLEAQIARVEALAEREDFGSVEDGFGMVVSRCAERCRVEVVRPGKVQCSPSCLLDHPEAGGE